MNNDVKKWLESLDDDGKMQAEVLDAYFTFRRNLPEKKSEKGTFVEDPKTTDDIMDDLTPMMVMDKKVVVEWMRAHEYHITTAIDGSPKWAIWRLAENTE